MSDSSIVSEVKEQGWSVIPDVVPTDVLERCYYDGYRLVTTCGVIAPSYPYNGSWQLRALELMEHVIDPSRKDSVLGDQFYIRPAVINDGQTSVPFLIDPRVTSAVEALLGHEPRITFTTLFVHEAETKRGPWHAGGPFNPDYLAHYPSVYEKAPLHLTAHLLVSDFSEENGGLLVRKNSHRLTTNPGFEAAAKRHEICDDESTISAKAGSVILTDSRLWYAVAPNPSDFPRMSIVVDYAPAKSIAKCSVMPQGVFNRLPPPAQTLFREWIKP